MQQLMIMLTILRYWGGVCRPFAAFLCKSFSIKSGNLLATFWFCAIALLICLTIYENSTNPLFSSPSPVFIIRTFISTTTCPCCAECLLLFINKHIHSNVAAAECAKHHVNENECIRVAIGDEQLRYGISVNGP